MMNLPIEFKNRMKNMLGSEYDEFIESYENSRYTALRINTLKCNSLPEKWALSPVDWEPTGYYYDENIIRPGKHPYHDAGAYYIQEPSAMLPGNMLDAKPGEYVLDLCAAPGGKSTQIAISMKDTGLLISNEIMGNRASILSENIERMGLSNTVVTSMSPNALEEFFPEYFDRIMVDAPCSGEGMFRKNEEAVSEWSEDNVVLCANRQDMILDAAYNMLAPGGHMVYSTCTFAELENEGSVSRFIERHPDMKLLKSHRMWPHKVKGEGHFAASFEKEGILPPVSESSGKISIPKEIRKLWDSFSSDILSEEVKENFDLSRMLLFGEQLYYTPSGCPDLDGLRVLRPGLHIGTVKKDRIEPSHALALFLKNVQAKHVCNLTLGDDIEKYLRGETFHYEGENGWYLISVDGYSIGWGKLTNGTMKNHYPKGLRKQK